MSFEHALGWVAYSMLGAYGIAAGAADNAFLGSDHFGLASDHGVDPVRAFSDAGHAASAFAIVDGGEPHYTTFIDTGTARLAFFWFFFHIILQLLSSILNSKYN